jgi:hypothetical protein
MLATYRKQFETASGLELGSLRPLAEPSMSSQTRQLTALKVAATMKKTVAEATKGS